MSAPELYRRAVRNLGSGQVHLVEVPAAAFGRYRWIGPEFTGVEVPVVALCGVVLRSTRAAVVCMRPGTPIRCRQCARLGGLAVAADDNGEMPGSGRVDPVSAPDYPCCSEDEREQTRAEREGPAKKLN